MRVAPQPRLRHPLAAVATTLAALLLGSGCASGPGAVDATDTADADRPIEAGASAAPVGDDIERLAWLAGPWGLLDGERVIEEYWMPPRGGMMLGLSRIVVEGRAISWEHMRIERRADGIAFVAHPSGQAETAFLERSRGATSITFENLDNDFPQRIHYELDGRDGLLAWIEGEYDGAMRRIKFPYSRPR